MLFGIYILFCYVFVARYLRLKRLKNVVEGDQKTITFSIKRFFPHLMYKYINVLINNHNHNDKVFSICSCWIALYLMFFISSSIVISTFIHDVPHPFFFGMAMFIMLELLAFIFYSIFDWINMIIFAKKGTRVKLAGVKIASI